MTDKTHRRTTTAAYTAALIAFAGTAAAGPVPYLWALPVDGFWNDPLNWNPNGVPGLTDDVELGLTGPYTISLGPATQDAATFRITNPEAALHIVNSRSLRIRQGIVNHGSIVLNPNNELRAPNLVLADASTIAGTGTIRLGAPGTRAQLTGFFAADTATHMPGHTIAGMGSVFLNLTNLGTITADAPGEAMAFFSTSLHNEAALSAVNAGVLDIRAAMSQTDQGSTLATGPGSRVEIHGPLTLSAASTVLADGPGSSIEIHGPQVTGGSLRAVNDSSIRLLTSDKTVDSVQLQGHVFVRPGIAVTMTNSQFDAVDITVEHEPVAPTTITLGSGSVFESGSLTLVDEQHRLQTAAGAQGVVFGSGTSLGAIGTFQLNAVNRGIVTADRSGRTLRLNASNVEHHGVLEAVGGGALNIIGSTITPMPGSIIRAIGPGSIVQIKDSTVGGEMTATEGAIIEIGSSSDVSTVTLDHPTLSGEMIVMPRTEVRVTGPLVNNTRLPLVFGASGSSVTQLQFTGNTSITGSGTIEFVSGGYILPWNGPATVTLGPEQTIKGSGDIEVNMIVEGTVWAYPGERIRFRNGAVTNLTDIGTDGGRLQFTGDIISEPGSRLVANDGGIIDLSGLQPRGRMFGGTIELSADSTLEVSSFRLQDVTINGNTAISRYSYVALANAFTNNGTFLVGDGTESGAGRLRIDTDLTIEGEGSIILPRSSGKYSLGDATIYGVGDARLELGPSQRLEGVGLIDLPLIAHGPVAPGGGTENLVANASIEFAPTATLEIEVSPLFNSYLWSRDVKLAGTLEIRFVDGFNPGGPYWQRTFMTALDAFSGSFDSIVGPVLTDHRLEYRVTYADTRFRIGTYCKADTNSDRQLNFFDVSTFINLFNAGDPAADIAAPFGTVNFFDLSTYINRFNAGCP